MPNCPNCGKEYNPGDEVCPDCGLVFPFTTDVLASGTILQGRYEIQELAYTGGMGYIYLAKDKKLYDRLCIVKQVKEPVKSDADSKKLEEEARRMAKLSHPNVAMILDHFVEDNHYFLVVERISGKTLSEVFEEHHGQLSEEEVIGWAIAICDVVAYIHEEGIIHRDISPDNVMLTKEGSIKFVDFGTLRELRYITTRGTAGMGKYGYTPPEQWQGKPAPQSDIFALGATIYYLLTGNLPLSKEYLSGQGPRKADFSPDFPPIRTKNPDISPELETVLQKALQLDVSNRYPSAKDFGTELRSLVKVAVPKREPSERAKPVLSVDTDRIEFAKVRVGSRATKTLVVENTGTGRLTGRITTSHPWLKVSPTDINLETGEQEIFVSLDKNYLRPGIVAKGEIDIDTNGGRAKVTVRLSTTTADKSTLHPAPARAGRRNLVLFTVIGLLVLIPLAILVGKNIADRLSGVSTTSTTIPSSDASESKPSVFGSPTDKIVYEADGGIWIVDADGSNKMNLAHFDGPASDFKLAVSPDGKKIAASPYDRLIVMNIDGSDSRTLAVHPALGPSWSPDGTNIVFDHGGEIYVVNINSGEEREITRWGSRSFLGDRQPSWSPDGTRVAFARMGDQFNEICVASADGSNVIAVYSEGSSGGDEWIIGLGPFWSPDSAKIIFGFKREDHTEIRIVNADGSDCRKLVMVDDAESLDWSPDGKKIAFTKKGQLICCTINADGTDLTELTEPKALCYYPKWSPDGKRIAVLGWFYSFSDATYTNGIYTMNYDGTDRNLVVSTGVDITSNPIWVPR